MKVNKVSGSLTRDTALRLLKLLIINNGDSVNAGDIQQIKIKQYPTSDLLINILVTYDEPKPNVERPTYKTVELYDVITETIE